MYTDPQEANQKLAGCVVFKGEEPVNIVQCSGKKGIVSVDFFTLPTSTMQRTSIGDKDWNFRDFGGRLGYVNVDDTIHGVHLRAAQYISRAGVRKSHSTQGLSQHNVRMVNKIDLSKIGLPPTLFKWQTMVQRQYLKDALLQKYPSVKTIAKEFRSGDVPPDLLGAAFARKYAISHDALLGLLYLDYRGRRIGYSEDGERFVLSNDYKYLQESLDEDYGLNIK